ncbi:hypothetical protein GCM10010472_65600 [Pseudonocardia halophobica]|uniref:Luciferase-like domain-containing protein n=1 Tax=Pseudonocardia halophobica TaxID=29401 RepID=A0A9W6L5I7_9PSEU|nr:LLM class flavin-dependent oxidoreductase [Pseudonocardia halophobica]GLL14011.1 hypothetical protein GCM10017577_51560 [Pseudonocardia halophobica]
MQPYAAGSVALGLHPPNAGAHDQVEAVLRQAVAAESAGFAGATLSEHHAGFPGYLPAPLLVSSWILAETTRLWSGPTPTLITVRNPALLAEEIAWTAARYPGRLGVAVAAGYTPADFTTLGLSQEGLAQRFADGVATLRRTLAGEGPLAADPAIAALATGSIPLLHAAHSASAAAKAAEHGTGILLIGSDDASRAGRLTAAYAAAGGFGPRVWIRRVHLGDVPQRVLDELERAFVGHDRSRGGALNDVITGGPAEIVDRLLAETRALGPNTALNLRVQLPGLGQGAVLEQIAALGADVLPALAHEWSSRAAL